MIVDLENKDIKFLKGEVNQILLVFSILLIVILLTVTPSVCLIIKINLLGTQSITVGIIILIMSLSIFLFFLYRMLKIPISDIRSCKKEIYIGKLLEKKSSTNYGWTGVMLVDMKIQPKLVEYFLVVDDRQLHVEKETYERFSIGDILSIHYTVISKKVIKVELSKKF